MQEGLELVEALETNDLSNTQKEIADAISNILSSYSRVTQNYEINIKPYIKNNTGLELAIQLGKRNDYIQKYRTIYSRSTANILQVQKSTEELIFMV